MLAQAPRQCDLKTDVQCSLLQTVYRSCEDRGEDHSSDEHGHDFDIGADAEHSVKMLKKKQVTMMTMIGERVEDSCEGGYHDRRRRRRRRRRRNPSSRTSRSRSSRFRQ